MKVQPNPALVILTVFTSAISARHPFIYKGCFEPAKGFECDIAFDFQSNFKFYTTSKVEKIYSCSRRCEKKGLPFMAFTNLMDCFCSDSMPVYSNAVDDSLCDKLCPRYSDKKCGDRIFFSVYLDSKYSVDFEDETATGSVEPVEMNIVLPQIPAENSQVPLTDISEL